MLLGESFELQGMEEVAARVLSPEEAVTYTIAREDRRIRLVRRRVAALWPSSFLLGRAFQVTVQAAPTCVAKTTDAGPVCSTVVTFMNISHEDQGIGPGSFGSVGPERSLFYEYQDYAIAVVRAGDPPYAVC